jgi:hypothetical protein
MLRAYCAASVSGSGSLLAIGATLDRAERTGTRGSGALRRVPVISEKSERASACSDPGSDPGTSSLYRGSPASFSVLGLRREPNTRLHHGALPSTFLCTAHALVLSTRFLLARQRNRIMRTHSRNTMPNAIRAFCHPTSLFSTLVFVGSAMPGMLGTGRAGVVAFVV